MGFHHLGIGEVDPLFAQFGGQLEGLGLGEFIAVE
jgi:hypothetical protein